MAKIIVQPASRIAAPGSAAPFILHVEDGDIKNLHVVPCNDAANYDISLMDNGLDMEPRNRDYSLSIGVPNRTPVA